MKGWRKKMWRGGRKDEGKGGRKGGREEEREWKELSEGGMKGRGKERVDVFAGRR